MNDRTRIHQVTCSVQSGPDGTDTFDLAHQRSCRLAAYARRLGFAVTHDNVDEGEANDFISPSLEDS